MRTLQDAETVERWLGDHPEWSGGTDGIRRSVTAPVFLDGIALVAAVSAVAEDMDHHPDMDIRWRTVTFALSTHSAGGVTELDLLLGERIDLLASGLRDPDVPTG
jgi:4a-hydroxytetrahydrobiopterin dehydratase